MKPLMILIVCLIAVMSVSAQGILSQTGGKIYIGVTAGPSFPLGDFANDDPENQKSSYATTGYKFELNAGVRLFNIIELTVMGFRNVNPTDPENLEIKVNKDNPADNYNIESDDWEIYGALAGITISYPLPEKFIMDIRILGGYVNISSPEFMLTTALPETYIKIEGQDVSTFTYFSGLSFRRPILSKLYALISFEYIGSNADFNDVKTIASREGTIIESTTSFERSLDAWSLSVGLKFFIL